MTATIFQEKCIGCEWCVEVCPHQIIIISEEIKKAEIINTKLCIECGACALQCPVEAIRSHPIGCGCVSGVVRKKINIFLRRENPKTCCN